jgi:hypothetical protein
MGSAFSYLAVALLQAVKIAFYFMVYNRFTARIRKAKVRAKKYFALVVRCSTGNLNTNPIRARTYGSWLSRNKRAKRMDGLIQAKKLGCRSRGSRSKLN